MLLCPTGKLVCGQLYFCSRILTCISPVIPVPPSFPQSLSKLLEPPKKSSRPSLNIGHARGGQKGPSYPLLFVLRRCYYSTLTNDSSLEKKSETSQNVRTKIIRTENQPNYHSSCHVTNSNADKELTPFENTYYTSYSCREKAATPPRILNMGTSRCLILGSLLLAAAAFVSGIALVPIVVPM